MSVKYQESLLSFIDEETLGNFNLLYSIYDCLFVLNIQDNNKAGLYSNIYNFISLAKNSERKNMQILIPLIQCYIDKIEYDSFYTEELCLLLYDMITLITVTNKLKIRNHT